MILTQVTVTPAKSRKYYGWYFFRGPPGFFGQVFIKGRGRR